MSATVTGGGQEFKVSCGRHPSIVPCIRHPFLLVLSSIVVTICLLEQLALFPDGGRGGPSLCLTLLFRISLSSHSFALNGSHPRLLRRLEQEKGASIPDVREMPKLEKPSPWLTCQNQLVLFFFWQFRVIPINKDKYYPYSI